MLRTDATLLARTQRALLDFFFPPRCVACGRGGAALCDPCRAAFVPAAAPRCPVCWSPGPAGVCPACRAGPRPYRRLRAAYQFVGPLRDAVHAVKYQGLTVAIPLLVAGMPVPDVAADLEVVTAVPMAGRRRRRRGYNQAEEIAQALARRLDCAYDGRALRRIRPTPQQARQPDVAARRRNVAGAFRADPGRISGRRILVVDDVTTSGATLEACAQALLDAGAVSVDAWTLARED